MPAKPRPQTPEEIEREWFENVYTGRGDSMVQLTLRAILMGSVLGGIMSFTNLYIGLKTGWGLGVAITSCILSFTIWKALRRLALVTFRNSWFFRVFFIISSIISSTLITILLSPILTMRFGFSSIMVALLYFIVFSLSLTAYYLIWRIKELLFPRFLSSDFTILENNAMQSTASSAGYSTGGTLVSAISAYLLVNGQHIPYFVLTAWIFFLAVLGVSLAIPMKRQMINIEKLRFPSGIAAAETLKSLHGIGDVDAEHSEIANAEAGKDSAKALFSAASIGAFVALLRDGFEWLPAQFYIFGARLGQFTIAWDNSILMIGAGAIMGFRVAWSILLGGILCWGVFAPWAYSQGIVEELGYRGLVSWTLWGGAACMVSSGLLSFGMQWRTALRAFSGLTAIFSKREKSKDPIIEQMNRIEVPGSWFLLGMTVGSIGVIYIINVHFNVPIWMAMLAIVMSFFLALVACRATGETDTTPIGAMGKITQLFYGAIAPKQMNVNLMTACVTAGVADSAADLLIDLKSGYQLGANPRLQFLAQFMGIFTGTLVVVPVFYLIVPTADVLGSDTFPAPAAQVWAAVARLLMNGFEALHPTARWAIVIGAGVGIIIPILEKTFPDKKKYIPSAMGLGLSWTFHFWYSLSMFIGGLIALIIEKRNPKLAEKYTIPVASGLIAGESLMGIFIIFYFMLFVL
ncbi:OPT/YSL family transporter [bacterium]|nr:OPT/YSL family transporter [bacterium]